MNTTTRTERLPPPARYFPITDGRYSTRAGLFRFGMDYGNGVADQHLFQFDDQYYYYHDNKLRVRNRLDDYCIGDDKTIIPAASFILGQLVTGHPELFNMSGNTDTAELSCTLTGNTIRFCRHTLKVEPGKLAYRDLLDALSLEVQEDICIMAQHDGKAVLTYAHLCAPNHWSAPDKFGMDMQSLHNVVPGFSEQNRQPDTLLISLLDKDQPRVRFAWGLQHGSELDQHPHCVTSQQGDLTMRIERQVLWPIPGTRCLLFTIRTLFHDCAKLKQQAPGDFAQLVEAITHMDNATLRYKNIDQAKVLYELRRM